jgi:hypothetical protein
VAKKFVVGMYHTIDGGDGLRQSHTAHHSLQSIPDGAVAVVDGIGLWESSSVKVSGTCPIDPPRRQAPGGGHSYLPSRSEIASASAWARHLLCN